MAIIFILHQVLAVDDDQQVIVGGFTFVKNIDLVRNCGSKQSLDVFRKIVVYKQLKIT